MTNYDDIINCPHHVSKKYPPMSVMNRAAQFAPFAALTGYDAAINEAARITQDKIELDDNSKEMLDMKLYILHEHISEHPQITITYFKKDEKKAGGRYLESVGCIKKIDEYENSIVLDNKEIYAISDIYNIESDFLNGRF